MNYNKMILKTKIFVLLSFTVFVLAIASAFGSALTFAEWDLTTNGNPTNVNSNVNAGNFVGGSGISSVTFGANGASASSWSLSGLNNDDYFQISISPQSGKNLVITDINFGERRSNEGIRDYQVQWSKSQTFGSPTTIANVNVPDDENERDGSISGLSITVNEGETLFVRFFGFNAESSQGTWRINDGTLNIIGSVVNAPDVSSLTVASLTAPTVSQNGSLVIRNSGNVQLSNIMFSSSGAQLSFNPSTVNSLNSGSSSQSIILSVVNPSSVKFGPNPTTITATSSSGTSVTTSSFNIEKRFCDAGERGGLLKIKSISIDNEGSGDDEKWKLLDSIQVEVEVEVDGSEDDDVDDIIVEIGLFDGSGVNKIGDLEFDNSDEEKFDVGSMDGDDDEETATFIFKVPGDMEAGNHRVAIKAYSDGDEDIHCVDTSSDFEDSDFFTRIDIEREDDEGKFIAFDEVSFTPEQAMCEESVNMNINVINIGDEDQEQVKILLKSSALGIDDSFEIRNDLKEGEDQKVSFSFVIPEGAENKPHMLELSSQYDYNNGRYRQASDGVSSYSLQVSGCSDSGGTTPTPGERIVSIDASLESDAVSGGELVVVATITNLKQETTSFAVDALDYQSWATLESISNRVVNLGAGQSKEVTFMVNEDAIGEESFVIDVSSGDESEVREIAVNIEGESGGITGGVIGFGDNAYLWIIGIINVVLVILIIVVAVRIARR